MPDLQSVEISEGIGGLLMRLSMQHKELIGMSDTEIIEQLISDKFAELYPPKSLSVE